MTSSVFLLLLSVSLHLVVSNPSCPELKPDMINVHLVCHTHDDVGWLKTVDQYFYGSRKDIESDGVQYIIDSVVPYLLEDPNKKFIYVESAFFFRWWDEQDEEMKNDVKKLVNNGQLEFINGGWCMNDEAAAHYNAIIDQMTLGLVRLNETFGPSSFPRIAWQIDPFGHSREQASLSAQMGMDGLFFGRLDYGDKDNRWAKKEMELVWKGSQSLGEESWIFTGALPNTYFPPSGFCFDIFCGDDPIMDDPRLEDYNKDQKVSDFIDIVYSYASGYQTTNVFVTMGSDFQYVYAGSWYKNLDKLIKYVNELQSNGSNINLVYSTPSCYLDSLHSENITWPTKTDDFFPYASDSHSYWTGYFTSRPTLKGFERQSNNILQAIKQFGSVTGSDRDESLLTLAEAMGVAQHHDAITGTSKQHVADDYNLRLSKGIDKARGLISKGFSYFTGNDETTEFAYCAQLNISSCPYVEERTSFVVNVYNAIGRQKSFYIRVPVNDSIEYTVQDQNQVYLENQVVPLPDQVVNLPGRESPARYELVFYAQDIPALGALQYLVEPFTETSKTRKRSFLSVKKEVLPGQDTEVKTEKLKVTFDKDSNKMKSFAIKLDNKLDDWESWNVTEDWRWYKGWEGNNSAPENRASGAYIFRPDGDSQPITKGNVSSTVYEGPLVKEIHQFWSYWVTQVTRLYQDKNYVEIEWLVGPIDISFDIGKEIVHRLEWEDFATADTFYTDSNGREMLKRVKDFRETWDLSLETENVSRNYYPVTAKFILHSVNGQGSAALLNDRAQGGTSLKDGQMELMVHRRLLYDDAKGVDEALNEEAYYEGLVARGRHLLIHSGTSSDGCDFGCQHRTLGEELLLQPIVTFSDPSTFVTFSNGTQAKSSLSAPLPDNIRLLTLEPWSASGTWLLRLENFYEANESNNSATVDVDVEVLFSDFTVSNIRELVLGANAYKEDVGRLQWNVESAENGHGKRKEEENKISESIFSFSPMQIRTFLIDVTPK